MDIIIFCFSANTPVCFSPRASVSGQWVHKSEVDKVCQPQHEFTGEEEEIVWIKPPSCPVDCPKTCLIFIFCCFLIWSRISRRSGGRRQWQWWDRKRGVWDVIGRQRCRGSQERRGRIYRRVVRNVWLDAMLLPRDWPLTLTLKYLYHWRKLDKDTIISVI